MANISGSFPGEFHVNLPYQEACYITQDEASGSWGDKRDITVTKDEYQRYIGLYTECIRGLAAAGEAKKKLAEECLEAEEPGIRVSWWQGVVRGARVFVTFINSLWGGSNLTTVKKWVIQQHALEAVFQAAEKERSMSVLEGAYHDVSMPLTVALCVPGVIKDDIEAIGSKIEDQSKLKEDDPEYARQWMQLRAEILGLSQVAIDRLEEPLKGLLAGLLNSVNAFFDKAYAYHNFDLDAAEEYSITNARDDYEMAVGGVLNEQHRVTKEVFKIRSEGVKRFLESLSEGDLEGLEDFDMNEVSKIKQELEAVNIDTIEPQEAFQHLQNLSLYELQLRSKFVAKWSSEIETLRHFGNEESFTKLQSVIAAIRPFSVAFPPDKTAIFERVSMHWEEIHQQCRDVFAEFSRVSKCIEKGESMDFLDVKQSIDKAQRQVEVIRRQIIELSGEAEALSKSVEEEGVPHESRDFSWLALGVAVSVLSYDAGGYVVEETTKRIPGMRWMAGVMHAMRPGIVGSDDGGGE